ncbi:hypothetical protein PMAYCL1PPCAC_01680, partial [Pristionchus mayeri]
PLKFPTFPKLIVILSPPKQKTMIARLFLPFLLIAASINAQSEEFLRLKKELEDRIAALRPEAREVAERLKSVFEARLPKDEAKARLNAVLESASDEAKAALETLKPNRKIDVEVVIPLPEAPAVVEGAELLLDRIVVPGLDRMRADAERLNLTGKTLTEALEYPNLASQLGIDRRVLDRIENLAVERGLANNTVDNVLHTLRYNLSSVVTVEERSRLEKFAAGMNVTSLEQLFEKRLRGAPGEKPFIPGVVDPAIEKFRNDSGGFIGGIIGTNRPGEFIDKFVNSSEGNFLETIKERFGNESSILEKFFTNATGNFNFGNFSEKQVGQLLEGLKTGNFSMLSGLFNGTNSNDGTITKLINAFKSGNVSSILSGTSGKDESSVMDSIKSFFNMPGTGSGGSSSNPSFSTGDSLVKMGSSLENLPSSFKNLLE